jgi:tetratricopeptide (TPR) repeat protein
MDRLASLSYGDLIRIRNARGADTTELLSEALSAFPRNCLLLLMESRRLIDEEHFAAAIEPLNQILSFDWATDPDDPPAYDAPIVGELPLSAKGLCLFRLGRYTEAAEAYATAARCAPENPSYPVKAELALARARKGATST